ncbi:hypothetical protein L1987_78725 [Smallanthus sonchifolius]|uniref:Uncharacterized protein n=1 Tax=Smallanthus sonchifolius TaxID=185202 RepID=A0ACB8ZHX9_9ASTR|nr:hypothetical protein L1987_78725 [Smallanthus sonchifolius]
MLVRGSKEVICWSHVKTSPTQPLLRWKGWGKTSFLKKKVKTSDTWITLNSTPPPPPLSHTQLHPLLEREDSTTHSDKRKKKRSTLVIHNQLPNSIFVKKNLALLS